MSPRGGHTVYLAPPSRAWISARDLGGYTGSYHTTVYTEKKGRVTHCGKKVTEWWQQTTEYRARVTHLRRPCLACKPLREAR